MPDIDKLEKLNKLCLNIYTISRTATGHWTPLSPLRISENTSQPPCNLLLIQEKTDQHFIYISEFNKLLNVPYSNSPKVHCPFCLQECIIHSFHFIHSFVHLMIYFRAG